MRRIWLGLAVTLLLIPILVGIPTKAVVLDNTSIQQAQQQVSFAKTHVIGTPSAPGEYRTASWTAPRNIRIVGFQLHGYVSAIQDNPFYHNGLADWQSILSLNSNPASADGLIGFLQGTSREEDIPRDIVKEQVVMFPTSYGIDLNAGESIYVHVYGRQDYCETEVIFLSLVVIYYTNR